MREITTDLELEPTSFCYLILIHIFYYSSILGTVFIITKTLVLFSTKTFYLLVKEIGSDATHHAQNCIETSTELH